MSYIVTLEPEILELVPGFLGSRAKDIATIRKALLTADYDAIGFAGHRMKGAGGGYGFHLVSELGGALESAAKERDAASVRRLLVDLETHLADVVVRAV